MTGWIDRSSHAVPKGGRRRPPLAPSLPALPSPAPPPGAPGDPALRSIRRPTPAPFRACAPATPRTSLARQVALALLAAGAAAACALATVGRTPLLWPVLRRVAEASPSWLAPRPADGAAARLRALAGHTTAMAVQYAAMERLRAAHPAPAASDDVARIMAVLVPLRRALVSQWQVEHAVADWPVALAGLGWCDQVNGAAAIALAPAFGGAALVGVAGRQPGDGHSFGRVWSAREGRWLYFDVWSDGATVLTLDARGVPRILAQQRIGARAPAAVHANLAHVYAGTARGVVHNVIPPSFGGYLAAKWRSGMQRLAPAREAPTAATPPASLAAAPTSAPPTAVRATAGGDARAAATYLAGRLRQLEGDTASARAAYCTALDGGRLSPALAGAARALVEQLGATCAEGTRLTSRAPRSDAG